MAAPAEHRAEIHLKERPRNEFLHLSNLPRPRCASIVHMKVETAIVDPRIGACKRDGLGTAQRLCTAWSCPAGPSVQCRVMNGPAFVRLPVRLCRAANDETRSSVRDSSDQPALMPCLSVALVLPAADHDGLLCHPSSVASCDEMVNPNPARNGGRRQCVITVYLDHYKHTSSTLSALFGGRVEPERGNSGWR